MVDINHKLQPTLFVNSHTWMKNAYLLLSVFQAISFFFPELYSDIPAGKQRTVWYEQKLQAQLGNSI